MTSSRGCSLIDNLIVTFPPGTVSKTHSFPPHAAKLVGYTMSEKIKDAVLAEAKNTQAVAHDVIMSGAYLYPFKVSSYAPQGECFPTVSNCK